jgi:4-hydroxy-3-methylbut-2-enyl diphosphate reductase
MAFADRLAAELRGAFPSTQLAPVLSANRTARGGERAVLSESGAVICDTESFWLARLAERRPFAVVRSIVDTPDRELMSVSTVTGGMLGLKRLADIARLIAGSGS